MKLETREDHLPDGTLAADSELKESWRPRTVLRSAEHSEALAAIDRTSWHGNRTDLAASDVHVGLASIAAVLQPLAGILPRLEPGEKPVAGAESRLGRQLATAVLR